MQPGFYKGADGGGPGGFGIGLGGNPGVKGGEKIVMEPDANSSPRACCRQWASTSGASNNLLHGAKNPDSLVFVEPRGRWNLPARL